LFSSCCSSHVNIKREQAIKVKTQVDSVNKCEYTRREALEQLKRGNLYLYRDFENYIHAKDYFLNKYNIQISPATKYNRCAQMIMDSVIFEKFGNNILLLAKEEMDKIYADIRENQISNGAFLYAEKLPEYLGGIDSLYCDIYREIPQITNCTIDKDFPLFVNVCFTVDIDGNIKEPQIVTKLCPQIDSTIIKVIKNLPKKWEAALINRKPVPYQMTLNIDWKPKDVQNCIKK